MRTRSMLSSDPPTVEIRTESEPCLDTPVHRKARPASTVMDPNGRRIDPAEVQPVIHQTGPQPQRRENRRYDTCFGAGADENRPECPGLRSPATRCVPARSHRYTCEKPRGTHRWRKGEAWRLPGELGRCEPRLINLFRSYASVGEAKYAIRHAGNRSVMGDDHRRGAKLAVDACDHVENKLPCFVVQCARGFVAQ